jgi:hypothetical protein
MLSGVELEDWVARSGVLARYRQADDRAQDGHEFETRVGADGRCGVCGERWEHANHKAEHKRVVRSVVDDVQPGPAGLPGPVFGDSGGGDAQPAGGLADPDGLLFE